MRYVTALMIGWLLSVTVAFAEAPILSALDAQDQLRAGEIVVLDIRSPEEWAETGVAEGAWPVSMHRPDFGTHLQAIFAQYAPEQVALICATGGRSAYIAEALERNGIVGVADVSEGMMGNPRGPGWIKRGMSVVSADAARAAFEAALSGAAAN
jgi:rhodanese-related sulfurtransferase